MLKHRILKRKYEKAQRKLAIIMGRAAEDVSDAEYLDAIESMLEASDRANAILAELRACTRTKAA